MTEDDRKWDNMKNAMILAMHSVMLSSEFKTKYYAEYQKQLSLFRQHEGDSLLRNYLKNFDNPEDTEL